MGLTPEEIRDAVRRKRMELFQKTADWKVERLRDEYIEARTALFEHEMLSKGFSQEEKDRKQAWMKEDLKE